MFFTLFDRKISPVILHGSEIWGFSKRESIELVNRYACKWYMCVGLNSSNSALLGYCGRFPLWIEAARRCIKYWLRILNMDESRYVKKCSLVRLSLLTMTNSNQLCDVLLFVCSKMADETNLSSKLPVVDRTGEV